jgi:transcriptional regulator with XRE-family HTH domain
MAVDFGSALKELQEKKGVSSSELAARLGVHRQRVDYLRNRKDVRLMTVVEVSDALGVSFNTLVKACKQ